MSEDTSDRRTDGATTTTRRTVLSATALGGGTASILRIFGSSSETGPQVIELGGEVPGWVGRQPPAIEGETNPTLPLTAGRTYQVTWENVDGAPHNFAVYDENETALVQTEIMGEQGATQSVEFQATTEMVEYICEVHPNTMRGDVAVSEETATPTATPTPEATEEPADATETEEPTEEPETEEPDAAGPAVEPATIEEHQGDVATFTLLMGGADEATFVLGSEDLNYKIFVTVIDGDDNNEVPIALDTFRAGRGTEPEIRTTSDEDGILIYRRTTPTLSNPLDFGAYPLEVSVDGDLAAVGTLALQPRETSAARAGVAPRMVAPSRPGQFLERVTRRDQVAAGDWAVVEVDASGLYATLDGIEDFNDESLGYELTIEETEALNREPDVVPLEDVRLLTDAENDRFFVVLDAATLRVDTTYRAEFAVTDANPYVFEGEEERVTTEFAVVERTATVDVDGDTLEVPPGEATITGTATMAPGTDIEVTASNMTDFRFLETAQTEVAEDGTWSVTLDFSDVEPGTSFAVEVEGLSDAVEGVVTGA